AAAEAEQIQEERASARAEAREAREAAAATAAQDATSSSGGSYTGSSSSSSSVAPAAPAGSGWLWPADGPLVSSFGYRVHPITGVNTMHAGIDLGVSIGAPVYAARSGTVYSAGWRGGYGQAVVVDHGDGLTTLSAHLSQIAVSSGQYVSQGEVIGYAGSTGFVTGPHLHFEVHRYGRPVDPMAYVG
ncbi:MAG: M23 family metallopeptidase, partial [Actinomycetota bacterium]|nr:M23 family metallopeptidase [Actinomycetota bacterium]